MPVIRTPCDHSMYNFLMKVNEFLIGIAERVDDLFDSKNLVQLFREKASEVGLEIPNMHDTERENRIKVTDFTSYNGDIDFERSYDGWKEGKEQFLGENNYVQVALKDKEISFGVLLSLGICYSDTKGQVSVLSFSWLEEDLSLRDEYGDGYGYIVKRNSMTLYDWLCKVGRIDDERLISIMASYRSRGSWLAERI